MSAEGWAGFAWVIGIWEQTVFELLAAVSPVIEAMSEANVEVALIVCSIWGILVTLRVAEVGFLRGTVVGLVLLIALAYGLARTTITLPQGGGTLHVTKLQEIGLKAAMGLHSIYLQKLSKVLPNQTIAGSILPAQAAMDRAVGRSAALYEGSDLARLIRDYNRECSPHASEVAGRQNATKLEALHAVGLMGGGGLGIPDEEIGFLSQISAGAGGLKDLMFGSPESNGGGVSWALGGSYRMGINKARDMRVIQQRRSAGLAMLQEKRTPLLGDRNNELPTYELPTQEHWEAVFAGRQDVKPSYLPTTLIPDLADRKGGLVTDEASLRFRPRNCAEAYEVAQLGAEQAYRALKASGFQMPGGQDVSAEAGSLAAAGAWQRFLSQSMQRTGMQEGNAEISSWMLSVIQIIKNLFSWLDLQTLLPMYVAANAWLFVLVILMGPIFLLMAPLRGIQVLIQWCQLLAFCVVNIVGLHVLTIMLSQVVAGAAFTQAATAAGWQASAPDDALRGSTGMIGAMLMAIVAWLAARSTGVDVSALAGSMSGAVSTATGAASVAGRVVGAVTRVGQLAKIGSAAAGAGRAGALGRSGAAGSGGARGMPGSVSAAMSSASREQNAALSASMNKQASARTRRDGESLNPPKPKPPII
ncbi:hypothetical protein [Stutzerimonas nitrititolerans]|uniref:hypothetical protein n=1 Tax=Stutzerimonas nitrititolerans TaxID=2482751 RepID=UPI0028987D15|nr:hypothetical protein [Stutzerimonas nitrititolerans]